MVPLGELIIDTNQIDGPANIPSHSNKKQMLKKYSTAKLGELALTGKESPNLQNHNI
jgi:hypothetical protein